MVLVAIFLHCFGHYANMVWRGDDVVAQALTTWEGATGHLLLLIFAIMYTTSWMRRGKKLLKWSFGNYDLFWITHQVSSYRV